jgi:hypothetical protein
MNTAAKRTFLVLLVASVVCLAAAPFSLAQTSRTFVEFISGGKGDAESGGTRAAEAARRLEQLCPVQNTAVANRLIFLYGAVFSAADSVQRPPTCYFANAASLKAFQAKLRILSAPIDGVALTLQEPAMTSLLKAVAECEQQGIKVRPFDGAIAAGRSYKDTARLWNTRFQRALDHWSNSGKIPLDAAVAARNESTVLQLRRVVEWESQGLWFGTSLAGSIFSSVAPPGTSQHLFLLAFDVAPPVTTNLVPIFNANGWYRTVPGDSTHFTYLGVAETELPTRGLHKITVRGVEYWVPALPEDQTTARSN